MAKVQSTVKLLSHTQNPIPLIYAAFRQCYHDGFIGESWEALLKEDPIIHSKFITNVLNSGHESPIEHVSFTFAVSGVSRALTHQLVRHRIASYSHQSQRYVDGTNFDYVVPPTITKNKEALTIYLDFIAKANETYKELNKLLGSNAYEDARFVLPQAVTSSLVITMNTRSLLHFFETRMCSRAQWEIRQLANEMLKEVKMVVPVIFEKAGATCYRLGYCPEGVKFTCGRKPVKQ